MHTRTRSKHRLRGGRQAAAADAAPDPGAGQPSDLNAVMGGGSGLSHRAAGRFARARSLAGAVGERLRALPPEARVVLEMLAVLDLRMPLALLGQAAEVDSPSAAVESALPSGLVDWSPEEPTCPVRIRDPLVREAIYAGIPAARRRVLHARAAGVVAESASWGHRVAALDRPDEGLAGELERLAAGELAEGRLAPAGTHLRWASEVSPGRADRERRLLAAAMHLMLAGEPGGLALRPAVQQTAPGPLRSCVLGTMACVAGQLAEAEQWFGDALARARDDPDGQPLAAMIASRQAVTYVLLGAGDKAVTLGRWALGTGYLDAAAARRTRTLVAIGACEQAGPAAGLAELGHLDGDPARAGRADADGLAYRGVFQLLAGDLGPAIADLAASVRLARRGATFVQDLRCHFYLALAQYLAGAWDDAALTCEQGLSAVGDHSRRYDLPLLHLAAGCVSAGRGATERAEQHARLAQEAAADLDYSQELVYAAMARALICQATADYPGMAGALGPWQDDAALDGRSRANAVLWRPLLAEGLIGSGQLDQAAAVVGQLRAESGRAASLAPALAWLDGWLAEQRGDPDQALAIYQRGEDAASTGSPVYTARLLLAHGRLLRRTGNRKDAVQRLRRAHDLYTALRAAPFLARAEQELAACDLPASPARTQQSVLALTSRETEVARLAVNGLSNPEIAAELFISRKAVEYHLGNVYAKYSLKGRQDLRRFIEQQRQPAAA